MLKCPTNTLSKVALLILSLITFIILSISTDMYKEYTEEKTLKNKNKWLKYQLTLFFCTALIVFAFFQLGGQSEYDYPEGIRYSSAFFVMNLISIISGSTLDKYGKMLFYIVTSLQMLASLYIFYIIISQFIKENPLSVSALLKNPFVFADNDSSSSSEEDYSPKKTIQMRNFNPGPSRNTTQVKTPVRTPVRSQAVRRSNQGSVRFDTKQLTGLHGLKQTPIQNPKMKQQYTNIKSDYKRGGSKEQQQFDAYKTFKSQRAKRYPTPAKSQPAKRYPTA